MKIDLDIDYEVADAIVVRSLEETIDSLEGDLQARKRGEGCGVFESDPKEDVKQIKKHLKAFKKVLAWYSVGGGE